MKKITTAALILASFGSTSSAFANDWWPTLPPGWGISIPPVTDWKVGGTLGDLWEDNKQAIQLSTIGSALLGPIGQFYGFAEGAKRDEFKKKAKEAYDAWAADQAASASLKQSSEKYVIQSETIARLYGATGDAIAAKGGEPGLDELNKLLNEANWCLIQAQDDAQATQCQHDFDDKTTELRKKFR